MRAITRGMWRAWSAGFPGALVAVWLAGLISPRDGWSRADALNDARCSVCHQYCRVLPPETMCASCRIHPEKWPVEMSGDAQDRAGGRH